MKITISLCVIVLNEGKFIGRALKNATPYVDEIIVVDGGSTDKTVEIAKDFKAKIIHSKWQEDFAKQRNVSLKHATKKWILVMDADEIYENSLLKALQKFSQNNIGIDAFAFPRKNYIDGKLTKAYPDRQTRFFVRNSKIKYQRKLHEIVVGYKMIASPTKLHIIHRKTSKRQNAQNRHYNKISRLMK